MSINQQTGFSDLCQKQIDGTDLYIDKTIQTVEFNMTRRGVKLKSEAAIAATCSLAPIEDSNPRKFYFDDTFVLFLQEYDKKLPYFALRVYDLNLINKTGKPQNIESSNSDDASEK